MTIKPARTKWEKEEEDSKVRFLKRQQRDKEADEQVDRYLKRPQEDEPDSYDTPSSIHPLLK